MSEPVVDVVVPVHTDRRPVARAAASVLRGTMTPTRVTIACHHVEPEAIAKALGPWADDSRIRLLAVTDGIPSPAGPINAGLDAASGEFTALLGSDDEYEPGAIDAWVQVARRDQADVVIPLTRTASGRTSVPPVRPFRSRGLDGVRDRLAYQTVQLGLVSRARCGHVRMTPGLTTGEDVVQGVSLWYSDASVSLARRRPGYVIHEDDAASRASGAPKPAWQSLAFLNAVLSQEFVARLSPAQRHSFAIKLLRTHIMDILAATVRRGAAQEDLEALGTAVERILAFDPSALQVLSRRDAHIIGELIGGRQPERLSSELALRTDFRRPSNVVSSSLGQMLHREAPLRLLAAIALTR